MRRLLFLAVLALIFLSQGNVFAASSNYEISTKYLLANDGTAKVSSTLTATNINAETTPSEITLPIVGSNPEDVVAKYDDGAAITSTLSEDKKSVVLKTSKDNTGDKKTWKVVLTYESDLAKKYGKTTLFNVPAQKYGDLTIKKEVIQMQAAVELGLGVARGPKPEITSVSLGEQVFTWSNKDGAFTESVGLIFGEQAVANFTLDTTLKNNSWWWQTLEVVMPPDTNQQSVVLDSIEPKPSKVRLDLDGNIIAEYSMRPKGSVNVKASGKIHVFNYSYALDGSSGLDSIPEDLKNSYTAANETWNGDSVDIDVKTDQPVSQIIEDVFMATVDKIPDDKATIELSQEWSNKLIGELRTIGIPARLVLGNSYTDGFETFDEAQPLAWVEAYAPATGWVTLDPIAQRGSDLYGFSDVQRIALVLRGGDPGYPPGELEDYSFIWQEGEAEELKGAVPTEIVAKNNIIFPGFAIRTIDVKMGSGTIVDNAAIEVTGEGITKLGSLAPLETSTTNMLAVGGGAFASDKVTYGILDNGSLPNVLAETTTTVNYIPFVAIIVAIIAFVVSIMVYKKYRARKRNSSGGKSSMVLADDDDGMDEEAFDFVDDEPKPNVAPPERPASPEPTTPVPPKPAQNVTMNQEITPVRPRKRPPRLIQ